METERQINKDEIEVRKVREDIIALIFPDQVSLTSTFLRPQEHYESPEFQDKIFTLDEFKEWYAGVKGSFSYYTDWSGFNIPSRILKPFREGKFDPLSPAEKILLDILKDIPEPSYVIALYEENKMPEGKFAATLKHETAHALFTLDSEYKAKVLEEIAKYDVSVIKAKLQETGYTESVLDDEVNAYSIIVDDWDDPRDRIPKKLFDQKLVASLEGLFQAYS